MRTSRIYTNQPLSPNTTITLEENSSRHLATVLRVKSGDPVILFNGESGEYSGELVDVSAKKVSVSITAFTSADRESPLVTKLGIGLSRGERFEWVLQKATELGVSEIYPLVTERTEVKLKGEREEKKFQRWQQLLISACEQCGRNRLPRLHPPAPLTEWQDISADIKLVMHHRSEIGIESLRGMKPTSVAMAIGPEGGLSDSEIASLLSKDFKPLTLGPRIFRTETAPIAVLSVVQGLWGDFFVSKV